VRPAAVCFDLDGLMFNTEHVFFRAGGILLAKRQREMTIEVMNVIIGRRPEESFKLLVAHLGLDDEPMELLHESRLIFDEMLQTELEPMPGLFDLLDRIEALGLPKGVATSSPRKYLLSLLDRFDLRDRFPLTLAAEDVTQGKPHPEIYLKAASHFGVSPDAMLVLEDSAAGTKAAVTAGAFAVSVPHEFTAGHDFTGAKRIIRGLSDPWLLNEVLPVSS
jgi:HAD superfamily hydrolase (TIGR01509 family)